MLERIQGLIRAGKCIRCDNARLYKLSDGRYNSVQDVLRGIGLRE